jgi:hypothetical protein
MPDLLTCPWEPGPSNGGLTAIYAVPPAVSRADRVFIGVFSDWSLADAVCREHNIALAS